MSYIIAAIKEPGNDQLYTIVQFFQSNMVDRRLLLLVTSVCSTQALRLLVSSYSPSNGGPGSLQTLGLANDRKTLQVTSTNQNCGLQSSWLDVSETKDTVLCVNEDNPGSVNLLHINGDGSLKLVHNASTSGGPVSDAFFGAMNNRAVALAHYDPPAISTFAVTRDNNFVPLQNFTFPGAVTGGVPGRQDTSHIHEALIDPCGKFLLFIDLGADLIHVYAIDPRTNALRALAPIQSPRKSGPRHGVFWQAPSGQTFLFVVHELSNQIISYKMTYRANNGGGGVDFAQVDQVSTFGNRNVPSGAAAAEIVKTPDNAFILASNRLAPIFDVPNPDPSNTTTVKSDSIVTFRPTAAGKLQFVQLVASGGLAPRHFSLNHDGSQIAVANGGSASVNVFQRDVRTGIMGAQIAAGYHLGPGALTNVQWLE
ncbi:hypothetical protein ACEQ8H_007895 [Pleosporales sp. CAS-2024a]